MDSITVTLTDNTSKTNEENIDWMSEADYRCNVYDFIIEGVLMGVLCVFGFVGNTLSSICLWRDKSKSATPFLLVSLEMFDTMFLITVVFLRVITSAVTFSPTLISDPGDLVPYIGKYIYPWAMVAQTGTIYVTLLVTFNRYVAVCRPYEASHLGSLSIARLHVVIVTIFSVLFNLPRFFEYNIEVFYDYDCQENILTDQQNGHQHTTVTTDNSVNYSSTRNLITSAINFTIAAVLGNANNYSINNNIRDMLTSRPIPISSTYENIYNNSLNLSSDTFSSVSCKNISYLNDLNPIASLCNGNATLITKRIDVPSNLLNSQIYSILYSNILYFLTMFLFPLSALVILNWSLVRALRKTKRKREAFRRRSDISTGSHSRSEDDITMMLIVVVLIFVVTQAPALVTQIMGSLLQRHDEIYKTSYLNCPHSFFYYARISDLLVVLSSSTNFVVYCLCSRRFRLMLIRILCGYNSGGVRGGHTTVDNRRQSDATGLAGGGASAVAPCSPPRSVSMRSSHRKSLKYQDLSKEGSEMLTKKKSITLSHHIETEQEHQNTECRDCDYDRT